MRYILSITFFIVLSLSSITAYSKPYVITSRTDIHNDNWYPLPEEDMKAASVDAALSELTGSGRFKIALTDKKTEHEHDGMLRFDISLIGPAETVKLTLTLQLKEHVTYVSSVAMDIHGMDYRGIYNAFEYVGREAAKRLNTKITMAEVNKAGTHAGGSKDEIVKPNKGILELFNQAQQLKREEHINEARVLFERVIEGSSPSEQQWSAMAKDELRYGLPIFEADNLMLNNTMQAPALLQQKMEAVGHLYRQILADNTDNPQRVIEMNKRLDAISMSRKALANAMKANALSRVSHLRLILQEHYMSSGRWPNQTKLEQEIQYMLNDVELIRYKSNNNLMELVIKDIQYGTEIELTGNAQGMVEIK